MRDAINFRQTTSEITFQVGASQSHTLDAATSHAGGPFTYTAYNGSFDAYTGAHTIWSEECKYQSAESQERCIAIGSGELGKQQFRDETPFAFNASTRTIQLKGDLFSDPTKSISGSVELGYLITRTITIGVVDSKGDVTSTELTIHVRPATLAYPGLGIASKSLRLKASESIDVDIPMPGGGERPFSVSINFLHSLWIFPAGPWTGHEDNAILALSAKATDQDDSASHPLFITVTDGGGQTALYSVFLVIYDENE